MKEVHLLFTSVGRRVSLLKLFKNALLELGINGKIIAADASQNSAARYVADVQLTAPRCNTAEYIPFLLQVCKQYAIDMLIPLIDTELLCLAESSSLFNEIGTKVIVSSPVTINICRNKKLTHEFLLQNGFGAPHVISESQVHSLDLQYPCFIKPLNGSSSINAFKIQNKKELDFFMSYVPNPILLEYINGSEYTIDVLVDFKGKVKCAVPRLRLETRAGEISKGITVYNDELINVAKRLVGFLPSTLGCITVQCFLTEDKEIKFIEINPRFGGGFPLSCEAGANFPQWLIQMYLGQAENINFDNWQQGVKMLRYDDAIFLREADQ